MAKTKRLKKELGLLGVYTIALGTTLSTGFFLLPGLAAATAGGAMPLTYLIAAIPLVPAVFSMVELSTAMPRAGGAYYFLDRSMGPLVGTIGGLGTWLTLTLKTAFALVGMGAYLSLIDARVPLIPLAMSFAVFFGVVNVLGAKGAGRFQVILVGGLLAILTWFMGGIIHINPTHFDHIFEKGFDSIIATAGLVYISFIGLTKVASISEEVKNPERNLPLGIFLALFTALIIYVVGTVVMVGVLPMEELAASMTPVAAAANHLVGRWGVLLVIVAAVCAFSSVANAGILSASRYPLAMSRDHILPNRFRSLSKQGAPVMGVVVTVGAILFVLALLDATKIAKLASAFQLLLFSLICLAVVVMRESRLDSYDPGFRSPWYPWMQIFGVVSPFMLIIQMGWMPILFTFGMVGSGVAWYIYYAKSKVVRAGAIYHIFERLGRLRFEGLDSELRGIMKEKGLRDLDPFDDVVARAYVLDAEDDEDFEAIAHRAAVLLSARTRVTMEHLNDGFLRGTRVGATPVSHGTALPHLRIPGQATPEMVMVRSRKGMKLPVLDEWGKTLEQEQTIEAFFFLVSPEENPSLHLRILAQIAGRVDDDDFLQAWLTATTEQELKEILLRDERYLSMLVKRGHALGAHIGEALHEVNFPKGCLVALVHREDLTFVPSGRSILNDGDRLTVIGAADAINVLRRLPAV